MSRLHHVWELPHRHIGRRVWHFPSLPSTNDFAASLSDHGIVVLADEQTAGRGQYGRTWHSPAGEGVWLSVRLDPPAPLRRPAVLTAWAAVSVCETIRTLTNCQAKIKWPNDVLIRGRKVCGVLIEQSRGVIAGIGLNVNQSPDFFTQAGLPLASSLAASSGQLYECHDVARALIAQLDHEYETLMRGDLTTLESCWGWRLGLLGREVIAELIDGDPIRGRLLSATFQAIELEIPGPRRVTIAPEKIRHLSEV
jgi:BirA family biotin operon repressor/biotin-[acetyl-CoA-carboxylase] ligase